MKNIFKPSTKKIILTFVLFVIGFFVGNSVICPPYTECEPPTEIKTVIGNLTLVPFATYLFMKINYGGFISIFLLITFYYLLSCLVISAYHRLKGKI